MLDYAKIAQRNGRKWGKLADTIAFLRAEAGWQKHGFVIALVFYDFGLHSQGSVGCPADEASSARATSYQFIERQRCSRTESRDTHQSSATITRKHAIDITSLPSRCAEQSESYSLLFIQLGDEGNPSYWTAPEVCQWLESIEMYRYCKPFAANQINGDCLYDMDDESLRQLEVSLEADRITLLEKIRALFGRGECFRFAYVCKLSWHFVDSSSYALRFDILSSPNCTCCFGLAWR